jgi:hypothetical protein
MSSGKPGVPPGDLFKLFAATELGEDASPVELPEGYAIEFSAT